MTTFNLSKETQTQLKAALEGLPDERRQLIVDAIASVIVEAQMKTVKSTFEEFRHTWSRNMATLLQ